MSDKPIVVVTGDVILAWDLIHRTGDSNTASGYDPEDRFHVYRQAGGAWHMTKIVQKFNGKSSWDVRGIEVDKAGTRQYEELNHAYATWTEFSQTVDDKRNKATRVKGHLGSVEWQGEPPAEWFKNSEKYERSLVKLVVVTDDGIENVTDDGTKTQKELAKERPNLIETLWEPGSISGPWVIWKDSQLGPNRTVIRGLSKKETADATTKKAIYDHTIAVVRADTIRKATRRIGHGQSWESVATETLEAVRNHEELKLCRWVIVSFTNTGALLVEHAASKDHCAAWLICDPAELEATWKARYPGEMVGSTTCMVAAVVKCMMELLEPADPTKISADALKSAVVDGIKRMRALHFVGYFRKPEDKKDKELSRVENGINDAANPTTRCVTEDLDTLFEEGQKCIFVCSKIPENASRDWSMVTKESIEIRYRPDDKKDPSKTLAPIKWEELHSKIVTNGADALKDIPRAKYDKLITTDPNEIDALAAIDTLFRSYAANPWDKPLSIAVFGSPGSGKSFGVKQIAKQLGGKISDTPITFNLSQFTHPDMLVGALHQVRDIGLKGKIPLVFWDEFDTSLDGVPLGWLRYFLAPMQDSEFLEGQITHPIGRAVFVFAGGTCETMKEFSPDKPKPDKRAELRNAKVPDFVSRLRGFLNVPGVNPKGERKAADSDDIGRHVRIRRAIILHELLKSIDDIKENEDKVRVSSGVSNAFLSIPKYYHGARSLEAVVRMSALRGVREFTASCLPNEAQLNLHVDGKAFLALAEELTKK